MKKSVHFSIDVEEQKGPPQSNGAAKKNDPNYIEEGVVLNESEAEYILPHFTAMVVGRPGAGKTYVIRQMLTENGFYKGKFDKIFLISPSATKMGIPVPKKQMNTNFDIQWIDDQLMDINIKQKGEIQARLREANLIDKFDVDKLNGQLMDEIEGRPQNVTPNYYQEKERFFSTNIFKGTMGTVEKKIDGVKKKVHVKSDGTKMDLPTFVDDAHQKFVKKMPKDMRRACYTNVLLVIDDMVSQIKANEFNPLLTQLIFNRRHLVINGMLSLMIVAQKFSMIPSRIRSNANWLIMFKQNPNDLFAVYKDLVQLAPDKWESIVDYVFGDVERNRNHLDLWVEKDKFFINFKPLRLADQFQNNNTQLKPSLLPPQRDQKTQPPPSSNQQDAPPAK